MFKKLSTHTCSFDCEWAPCPDTARRLLGLPAATSDREATAALWRHYPKPGLSLPAVGVLVGAAGVQVVAAGLALRAAIASNRSRSAAGIKRS